jgi:peptidoglycan DL-endopeptidase CwlO
VAQLSNRHSVAPAFRASDARLFRKRSLWMLPLVLPGVYSAIASPALAAVPTASVVAAPTTQSVQLAGAAPVSSITRGSYKVVVTAPAVSSSRAVAADAPIAAGDLGAIASYALRFVGTPYVYGGSTPAGFDCSGFTAYVYAHVGISLPHSSAAQGRMGTRIALADARPGDLVIVNGGSHVGIYLGGGTFIDAPYPGRTIQARAIYTSNYYIVRI